MDAEIGQLKWTFDPDKPVWTPDQPADAARFGKRFRGAHTRIAGATQPKNYLRWLCAKYPDRFEYGKGVIGHLLYCVVGRHLYPIYPGRQEAQTAKNPVFPPTRRRCDVRRPGTVADSKNMELAEWVARRNPLLAKMGIFDHDAGESRGDTKFATGVAPSQPNHALRIEVLADEVIPPQHIKQ